MDKPVSFTEISLALALLLFVYLFIQQTGSEKFKLFEKRSPNRAGILLVFAVVSLFGSLIVLGKVVGSDFLLSVLFFILWVGSLFIPLRLLAELKKEVDFIKEILSLLIGNLFVAAFGAVFLWVSLSSVFEKLALTEMLIYYPLALNCLILIAAISIKNNKKASNPTNWSTEDKETFLDLIERMGTNSVWRPEAILKRLEKLPCAAKLSENGRTIVVLGSEVPLTEPENGESGIYGMRLLELVIEKCGFAERITSDMTGSGFYMRDVLTQLAVKWGVNKNYL